MLPFHNAPLLKVLEMAENGKELQEQRVPLQDSDEGGVPRRWGWERLRTVVGGKVPVDNQHEDQALRVGRVTCGRYACCTVWFWR